MRVLSLFSGIGAMDLGLERAGMTTVAFCEIDPFCRSILAKHWPKVPCYDDVQALTGDRLVADGITGIDLIAGGFPCQGISIAGRGAGLSDPRSGLWSEFARLIGELRPRFVLIENSPKLRSRGLHTVLTDLDALGFDAEWHCIPAAYVGAPHRRDRIWIIANRQGDAFSPYADRVGSHQAQVHFRGSLELLNQQIGDAGQVAWGSPPPEVQRVVDGAPSRLDVARLGGCGRAVVPLIPELIGNAILAATHEQRRAA